MWVITHEIPLHTSINLEQSPSVWSGGKICIGNRQEKETTMTKEEIRNILDKLDDLTLGLDTAENALEATSHFFSKDISTQEKRIVLVLEYDTQSAIFNLAYDCLIKTKENLVNAIGTYRRELEE